MSVWPRTIHARLTLGYAVAFFAGLGVFSVISFSSLSSALKAVVDARLVSADRSITKILATDPGFNHTVRERLDLVMGSNLNGAILSASGKAIYSSVVALDPAVRRLILDADDNRRLTTLRTDRVAARIMVTRIVTRNGSYDYLGVWRPLDLVNELERLRVLISCAAVVVIGASAAFVGGLIARHGLKPLHAMASVASEIEAHDLSRRLGVTSDTSDLGALATTFDRMLARLEAAFERQRRFTADASHELRAPLMIVRIAAELALRREREPAAYRRVLASILQATRRLEHLTDDLLVAARADAGQISLERVDLSAVLAETLDQVAPLAESKRIQIVAKLASDAYVNVDRSGVVRAATALIDNAIKFSPEGGRVEASVTEAHDRIRFTVQDEGPGFSSDGLKYATERFWRSDTARAPGSGFGLGLAICNSIVRASGGTLAPQNAAHRGALIVVEFPRVTE